MLRKRILVLLLVLIMALGGSLQAFAMEDTAQAKAGDAALVHLKAIADGIGSRVTGTDSNAKMAAYIEKAFKDAGYSYVEQPFTFKVEEKGKPAKSYKSKNIIVVKPGISKKEIVVGAHYDSVNVGTGADDNGSSIAVMLETAQKLKNVKTPYTIRFIAFGAEELGLYGSKHYVSKMSSAAKKNTLLMVNMDSLIAGDNMYVYGGYGKEGLARDYLLRIARENGLKVGTNMGENPDFPLGSTGDWSDHAPFVKAGIPYVYFEGTNWLLGAKDGYTQVDPKFGENGEIWHTDMDSIEYLEKNFPGRVSEHLCTFSTLLWKLLTEYKFQ